MPILTISPHKSQPTPEFWSALTAHKLDHLKLDDSFVPIHAYLEQGKRVVIDRNASQESDENRVGIDGSAVLGGDAFVAGEKSLPNTMPMRGTLKLFNTIEEFSSTDLKKKVFHEVVQQMLQSFDTDTPLLNTFLLVTFADLKKYKYHYWFAFPGFVASPPWNLNGELSPANAEEIEEIRALSSKLDNQEAYLVRGSTGQRQVAPLTSCSAFFDQGEQVTIAFHDPSSSPSSPGWPIRNYLFYLNAKHNVHTARIICLRDGGSSLEGIVNLDKTQNAQEAKAVGWEVNKAGKLGSRVADLGPLLDPARLAAQAVDLNLKLIKWRIMPSLNLDKISQTKCLLLGAGTLGCYVARVLMGWGVRNITFVDSSTVSYSNPVRQPLFTFTDSLSGGAPKAQCAADALKSIFPGVNAQAHSFSIPMPGHPPGKTVGEDVQRLEGLVRDNDAVFLLMDSRESRWLPTVMGAREGKVVINAALGFDGYLVMRHGAGVDAAGEGAGGKRLGCYYCNDVVAPADSLKDRTLDQMCTVTRPGVAPIAAAMAVELLVSLLQHPLGINAPADSSTSSTIDTPSPLGLVPHQLRGTLHDWKTHLVEGAAYDRCTGCSKTIVEKYKSEGLPFLLSVFNNANVLEQVTGLDKLQEEGERMMEEMGLGSDDEEGDDF
ncbi:E1-like protein-activating enzyme Gsa7p/Apg7p [Cryptococcus floricola]|uniref:Ubiquitin-like modifier-activating enzyme ATG7 n=1 Tax=Cryptococcus floricola TaxID=2591691 RepID=A0A5D3AW55_9TREE|nr:E1-like protein-activating enzyme Gsa7p/Apg7p [Cryptococcus floricola]